MRRALREMAEVAGCTLATLVMIGGGAVLLALYIRPILS